MVCNATKLSYFICKEVQVVSAIKTTISTVEDWLPKHITYCRKWQSFVLGFLDGASFTGVCICIFPVGELAILLLLNIASHIPKAWKKQRAVYGISGERHINLIVPYFPQTLLGSGSYYRSYQLCGLRHCRCISKWERLSAYDRLILI